MRSLVDQILWQLAEEMPESLPQLLAPHIRLAMGIPRPLGSPLVGAKHDQTSDDFLQQHQQAQEPLAEASTLDLGCGTVPRNPFKAGRSHGIDIRNIPEHGVVSADLSNGPIPFPDSCFDFVTAFDFIEHVPRVVCTAGSTRFPFVALMDEIHRVLKPGGIFFSKTPAFPSQEVFQDPTHVNPITENTLPLYFCRKGQEHPWARMYGFSGTFELMAQGHSLHDLLTLMRKA
ncbi:class I SAM-dependent methyltransferase [Synechococcus sp. CCY 9618]|uniref:methyltransferase domain-containing protein n=1 Tax=Synechococcus sp. CCY 9618 TaxID=2815602 RepID=UPI0020B1FD91|nr:class I SAM-dependent methyltransferase [Synechococcus sp. CCY 9618]